jgi:hypothetical protein
MASYLPELQVLKFCIRDLVAEFARIQIRLCPQKLNSCEFSHVEV